jgi:hypothetical protein
MGNGLGAMTFFGGGIVVCYLLLRKLQSGGSGQTAPGGNAPFNPASVNFTPPAPGAYTPPLAGEPGLGGFKPPTVGGGLFNEYSNNLSAPAFSMYGAGRGTAQPGFGAIR